MIKQEMDTYPHGALLVTKESKISYANEFAAMIFKYDQNELINGDLNSLLPKEVKDKHNKFVEDFFNDENKESLDKTVKAVNKFDKIIQIHISVIKKKQMINNKVN